MSLEVDFGLFIEWFFRKDDIVLVGIYFINNSRGLFFLWSLTSRVCVCVLFSYMLHGAGICSYIYHRFKSIVGKYSIRGICGIYG